MILTVGSMPDCERNETKKKRGPLEKVEPLDGGKLRITFDNGDVMTIHLLPHLTEARLHSLNETAVWESADTDGRFVHWYRDGAETAELAWDELLQFAVGKQWY